MNIVDIIVCVAGVGIISLVILYHIGFLFHQIRLFKSVGGKNIIHTIPNMDETKELLKKKRQQDEEEDCSYQSIYQ